MSLATEALLIGSYAAQLRGVLPAWRAGSVGDADFVCTRRAAGWIMDLFGSPVVEHAPDRCFRIDRAGGLHIDMDLRGYLLPSVAAYADLMQIQLNDRAIECLVARPALILALRQAAKARDDIDSYRRSGVRTPPALASAALAFRKPTGE